MASKTTLPVPAVPVAAMPVRPASGAGRLDRLGAGLWQRAQTALEQVEPVRAVYRRDARRGAALRRAAALYNEGAQLRGSRARRVSFRV